MSAEDVVKPTPPTTKEKAPSKTKVKDVEPSPDVVSEAVEDATPDNGGRDEIERLDPSNGQVILQNGTLVAVLPLKMRQFMRLLKILTRGASGVMDGLSLGADQDNAQFVQQLLALVIMAVPEAEDETVAFVQSMCKVDDDDTTGFNDMDLWEYLYNPELEELVSIVEVIVHREGADIQALGKRLGGMLNVVQKKMPKTLEN